MEWNGWYGEYSREAVFNERNVRIFGISFGQKESAMYARISEARFVGTSGKTYPAASSKPGLRLAVAGKTGMRT